MKRNLPLLYSAAVAAACTPLANAAVQWDAQGAGNPVIPGYFADPCARKFGDIYYIYVTPDGWDVGRGPAGVWSSKDFVNWTWQSMNWPVTEFKWAPSVVEFRGKYYMYSSVPCQIWAAVADHPAGPWTNLMGPDGKEMIPDQTPKGTIVLDAEAFIDDDESVYLWYSTWWRPTMVKLKPDMKTFDGDPIQYFKHEGLQNPPKGLVTGCMEAPYMFKRNGIYYLLYSDAFCQDSTYNVKYSTSRSPDGPFDYDPAKNPILETTDDGTVDGPGHQTLLVDGDKLYLVYHRHDNPHSADGAHRQTCISELHFTADGTIEKIDPDHAGVGYLAPSTKRDTNLAAGRPVKASSHAGEDFRAEYAVDENNGTLWKAADASYPQSLQVDLGSVQPVRRVETEFQYPQVPNRYVIEISDDGSMWRKFADRSSNTDPGVMVDKGDDKARHVRITLLGQDSGRAEQWASLWGFRVYDGIDKPNQAPAVDPGGARVLNFRYPSAVLDAAVRDDGLPNGPVKVAWSKVSGPGNAVFAHADRRRTSVQVDQPGKYVFKLRADDGALAGEGLLEVMWEQPHERVVALDFDNDRGLVAVDASGNGRDAVLRKGAVHSPGMRGMAVNLDGADDHLTLSVPGTLQKMTLAAWVNVHELHADACLFSSDNSGEGSVKWTLNAAGALQLAVGGGTPVVSRRQFAASDLGVWHHVAVTYDPEAGKAVFYIDGREDVSLALAGAPKVVMPAGARIGGAAEGARGFRGEIDAFRIWEAALKPEAVAGLAERAALTTVAEACKLPDGSKVVLSGKPVTFAPADPLSLERSTDYFYLSELDGSSGLRVETGAAGRDACAAGSCVSVSGTMATRDGGVRCLVLDRLPARGASRGAEALPLERGLQGASGGVLVGFEGTVKEVLAGDTPAWVVVPSGGGDPLRVGVRHLVPQPVVAGNEVAVTGIVVPAVGGGAPSVLAKDARVVKPPQPDLMAHYPLDNAGESAADRSGAGRNAAVVGQGRSVDGKVGKALGLDGERTYLQVPDLGVQHAVTIALWVRLDAYAKDTFASVVHADGWGWGDIHWNVAADNKRLNLHVNGIGELRSNHEFSADRLGQWTHVAMTYDAAARSLKMYVNGQLEAESGIQAPRGVNLARLQIGCWNGRERLWNGAIDDVRILRRALNANEIAELVHAAR